MRNKETQIAGPGLITITNLLPPDEEGILRDEIVKGLNSKQKYIPSKFFYDDKGSDLFEQITGLPEYYPARTERAIMKKFFPEQFRTLSNTSVIEFGSGDCSKISILFDSVNIDNLYSNVYVPVDFSQSAMEQSFSLLEARYPGLYIEGYVADFHAQLKEIPHSEKNLYCLFGSTIGNFTMQEASDFISQLRELMKKGDQLLLGLDMVKDVPVLERAYNDSQLITAAFNKNILNSVNSHIGSVFNPDDFDHVAFFNSGESRIEMHLRARRRLIVPVGSAGELIYIERDETIHTENSHKFTMDHISELADVSGLTVTNIFTDHDSWFSLVHYTR